MVAWTIWKPAPCASLHGFRKLKKRARRYGSDQIASVPNPTASTRAATSKRRGTPATRKIASIIPEMAIVVPRSGSSRTSPQKIAVRRPSGRMSWPSVRGGRRLER